MQLSQRQLTITGILFYLIGVASCSSLNVFMVEAINEYGIPILEVMFLRQFFIFIFLVPLMIKRRFHFFDKTSLRSNAIRNILLSISTFLIYVGMSRVPVNDATAISFLTPMIAGFLAVKLLGEKAPKSINYAFIVAIIGVIVIKRPTFDIDNATIGYLALLAYTCIRAYIVILDKRLTSKFDPMTMMFYSCIILGLFAGCFFPFFIKVPLSALKYIAISGFLFFVEYYCIFRALKLCNAVILQPLDFSKLIFTMIFSYIFLGQQVNAHQIIGGSIIILGYLIVFIETKIKNTAK